MGYLERLPGVDGANTTRRNATATAAYILAGLATVDGLRTWAASEPFEEPVPTDLPAISEHYTWLQASAHFSGDGATVTDEFRAVRFTTILYEYDGTGRFSVALRDVGADEVATVLVDESAPASGAVGVGLPDGSYALDIDADGDWEIDLGEPEAPTEGRADPPVRIAGEGPEVFGKLAVNDQVTVSALYEGDSEFIVRAWDEANTGESPDATIFEEQGDFDGETSIELSGFLYITVEADGPYQIEIV